MSGFLTILKRELSSYFNSAVGYAFIVVFQVIASILYVTRFFDAPYADMRSFFGLVPIVMCVFIPLVTMRLWAEDRKENTYELLMTFPMSPWSLVMGKFVAGLVFFVVALAATFVIPVMLGVLGEPDWGRIVTAYLGTMLLGAMFLALGLVISGFCRDQIVAAVVAVLACFGLYLLGTDFVAGALDEWSPELEPGTFFKNYLGVTRHHETFTRGVIETLDVLYFVVWIGLFLMLNQMYIQGRNRPGSRAVFAAGVVLCLGIGLGFNAVVSDVSLGRIDNTEGNVYSLSETSWEILDELKVPVRITYYVTPSSLMPTDLKSLEKDVVDRLKEIRTVSGGKVDYRVVSMQASNILGGDPMAEGDEEPSLEQRMLEKGIEPIPRPVEKGTGFVQVYSAIGIAYKDQPEVILPQILPGNLPELEYMLMNEIYRMIPEEKPVVALVAPKMQVSPMIRQMYPQAPPEIDRYRTIERLLTDRLKYEVKRVADFGPGDSLPAEYDILAIVDPQNWGERHRWEVARALRAGKPTFVAVQRHLWQYTPNQRTGRMQVRHMETEPQVNELFERVGASIEPRVLMDRVASERMLPMGGMQFPFPPIPIQIRLIETNMAPDHPITRRMNPLDYHWGSAVAIDADTLSENGLEHTVLMRTSPEAWLRRVGQYLSEADLTPTPGDLKQYPVAVDVRGQFPDVYADIERPEWPEPQPRPGMPPPSPPEDEGPAEPIEPNEGRLILTGCADMLTDDRLDYASYRFFANSIDSLAGADAVLTIRNKTPVARSIGTVSDEAELAWKLIHFVGVAALVALVGLTILGIRWQRRRAYEQKMRQAGEGG